MLIYLQLVYKQAASAYRTRVHGPLHLDLYDSLVKLYAALVK